MSWFQPEARLSLELIQRAAPARSASSLDVGGGASTLVDGLRAVGYEQVTVLDISAAALEQARHRLGPLAAAVMWREADVLTFDLPGRGESHDEILGSTCASRWEPQAIVSGSRIDHDMLAWCRLQDWLPGAIHRYHPGSWCGAVAAARCDGEPAQEQGREARRARGPG